jgi:hypothetical protein
VRLLVRERLREPAERPTEWAHGGTAQQRPVAARQHARAHVAHGRVRLTGALDRLETETCRQRDRGRPRIGADAHARAPAEAHTRGGAGVARSSICERGG